jgi:hypothetical protein
MINNTTGSLIVHQGYITTRFKYTVCTTALMYIHLLLKYFIAPGTMFFFERSQGPCIVNKNYPQGRNLQLQVPFFHRRTFGS